MYLQSVVLRTSSDLLKLPVTVNFSITICGWTLLRLIGYRWSGCYAMAIKATYHKTRPEITEL